MEQPSATAGWFSASAARERSRAPPLRLAIWAGQKIADLLDRQRTSTQVLRQSRRRHHFSQCWISMNVATDPQIIEHRADDRKLEGDGRGALSVTNQPISPPQNICWRDLRRMTLVKEEKEFTDDAAVSAASLFRNRALAEGSGHMKVKPLGRDCTGVLGRNGVLKA